MKKGGSIAALVIVILAVLVGIKYKDVVDRFNPLMTKEYVYVQITKPGEPDEGRYKYVLAGYNAQGEKKEVTFTASLSLLPGTYLKVLAKGAYAQEWEEVKKEDIPKAIKW
ncbi:YxeA family protein [Paenibacillus ehimensis]|uniref:YxeA family protein n=1 Tax=Paenibacillus ehimensis TaxID=79264 RepID=A0ABT8V4J5_9BACL|nr:YxeA family protein [Paenibacillus ehimensis]MDO3675424.1 YxeA family protein [Paenibacillus ehimensis]MEC0208997.1 YxeA family protein [Paenibacillus ehimensis]